MPIQGFSHFPLKKRPIQWVKPELIEEQPPLQELPQNLSTKPEDLRVNKMPLLQLSFNNQQHFHHQTVHQHQHQPPPFYPFNNYPVMQIPESPTPLPLSSNTNVSTRYNCPSCNKSYSTYSGMTKHMQFHCAAEHKKSFVCKFCEKVYVSLGALKMHIRTHTLPCKCTICGKAFSRPWLLQGHIRIHTGEKPFSCHCCQRSFADRSNLRAHLQTHSEVKKYCCKKCSKTFSRMSLLVKHEEGGCC